MILSFSNSMIALARIFSSFNFTSLISPSNIEFCTQFWYFLQSLSIWPTRFLLPKNRCYKYRRTLTGPAPGISPPVTLFTLHFSLFTFHFFSLLYTHPLCQIVYPYFKLKILSPILYRLFFLVFRLRVGYRNYTHNPLPVSDIYQ